MPRVIVSKGEMSIPVHRIVQVSRRRGGGLCESIVPGSCSGGAEQANLGQRPKFRRRQCILPRKGNTKQPCGTLSGFVFGRNDNLGRRSSAFANSLAPG